MKKRHYIFIIMLVIFAGYLFPLGVKYAMAQRGQFAIGGEFLLPVYPVVLYQLWTTLYDMMKGDKGNE